MRPTRTQWVILLLTLSAFTPLAAQERGDSLRVRYLTPAGEARVYGLYLGRDSTYLALRVRLEDTRLRTDSILRMDRWQRGSPALQILGGAAIFAVGQAIWFAADEEYQGLLGRDQQAASILVSAGIGAALGGLIYLIDPGDWKRIRP
jgi:hypothetical protein